VLFRGTFMVNEVHESVTTNGSDLREVRKGMDRLTALKAGHPNCARKRIPPTLPGQQLGSNAEDSSDRGTR
jgi:hypothetical protein